MRDCWYSTSLFLFLQLRLKQFHILLERLRHLMEFLQPLLQQYLLNLFLLLYRFGYIVLLLHFPDCLYVLLFCLTFYQLLDYSNGLIRLLLWSMLLAHIEEYPCQSILHFLFVLQIDQFVLNLSEQVCQLLQV